MNAAIGRDAATGKGAFGRGRKENWVGQGWAGKIEFSLEMDRLQNAPPTNKSPKKMSSLIQTYLIPAATFILGILVKFAFDSFANKQEYNRKRNDDVRKNRREVYLDFLISIENVLISGSKPNAEAVEQSKKKLVAVELDGSEHVILFARILLMRLEAQSNAIESSHDKFIPTFRKYFLELARAELANREPDVKHLEQELLQDPFIAMLSGVPTEPKRTGTVEVLFEIGKKRPTNINQPKS